MSERQQAKTWVSDSIPGILAWMQSSEFKESYSGNTMRSIATVLKRFSVFVHEKDVALPSEVNSMVLRQYRRKMVESDLKSSTLSHDLSMLDFFFDYLVFVGDIEKNPVTAYRLDEGSRKRHGGRETKRLPTVLMISEQDALVNAFFQSEHVTSPRNTALAGFLFDSGLRVSEVIGLSVDDGASLVHRSFFRIIGKGNKERRVEPMRHYASHWDTWIRHRIETCQSMSEPLFTSTITTKKDRLCPMSQSAIFYIIKHGLEIIGVNARQKGAHLLRHSAASRMLHDGRPIREVQDTLGHDSIQTTELYLHLVE